MATTDTVHPHVRGEYSGLMTAEMVIPGSSPRAWGIRPARHGPAAGRRFIPTCVGNTAGRKKRCGGATVHPHVRGEYVMRAITHYFAAGSSPRAWGIRGAAQQYGMSQRFIPTCVGNTLLMWSQS